MSNWINSKLENLSIGNKNNNKYHTQKTQSQIYATTQRTTQQTIETETVIECVSDAIETVVLAAELYTENKLKESTINRASDTAIRSLNLLAFTCESLHKKQDHYTIDLMKKEADDQFEKIQQDDNDTYNLLEPHRNFIYLALDGQENLRYKTKRAEPSSKHLFDNDAETINKVFGQAVMQSYQFDQRQKGLAEPQRNKELNARHQSDHAQYHKNKKYKKKQQKYIAPKQSDLYFTQSGKQSKFVNKRDEDRKQAESKAMDQDIYEPEQDVYETLKETAQYPCNAVWKLSRNNTFKLDNKTRLKTPTCCEIVWPNEQNVNRDKTLIKIVPCYPWNTVTVLVKMQDLELNTKQIIETERKHIKSHGKLGYKSIDDYENEEPTDFVMNGYD